MSLTSQEKTYRGRKAAHTRWANTDPEEASKAASDQIRQRFLREADPDGVL